MMHASAIFLSFDKPFWHAGNPLFMTNGSAQSIGSTYVEIQIQARTNNRSQSQKSRHYLVPPPAKGPFSLCAIGRVLLGKMPL